MKAINVGYFKSRVRSFVALFVAAFVFCALFAPFYASALPSSELGLSAESAILIDADDKSVIYQRHAHRKMGMASTTKIMTALVALELLPFDKIISIPREAVGIEGSSVYLCEGELLSVEQLLYALMLASANDAATALAIAASGSVEAFAKEMNRKAHELGLENTNFTNPHGLYSEEHYTTAYDLAMISAAALGSDTLREIVATKKTTIPQGVTRECPEGNTLRYLYNHNKMLSLYDGAIGLKTGFTRDTGRCLVSAAKRDGLTLIAITLNAPDDWNDHTRMLDYGYSLYERVTLFGAGDFSYQYAVAGGCEDYVTLTNSSPISLTLPKKRADARAEISAFQHFEFAPIARGERLAYLTVSVGEKSAGSPLIAAYKVDKKRQT